MTTYIGPGQSSGGVSNDFPIMNGMVPKEGPKAIPVLCQFGTTQSFTIDFQNVQSRGVINSIQTVFIDNSGNTKSITLTDTATTQEIICPGNSQGYFPIMVPNPPVFTAVSTGTANVQIIFMNVQINPIVWNALSSGNIYDSNGNLKTSDQNLVTAISGGYVNNKESGDGTGDTTRWKFNGNKSFFAKINTTATSVALTTGAPSFYLTNLHVTLDASASIAAAGDLTVSVMDGTTTVASAAVLLGTASATGIGLYHLIDIDAMNYNSGSSAAVLSVTLSTSLTGGTLSINALGGLTSQIL